MLLLLVISLVWTFLPGTSEAQPFIGIGPNGVGVGPNVGGKPFIGFGPGGFGIGPGAGVNNHYDYDYDY